MGRRGNDPRTDSRMAGKFGTVPQTQSSTANSKISEKHMQRYLGEIEFRWNRRGSFESRLAALFGTKSGPLPLKVLFA